MTTQDSTWVGRGLRIQHLVRIVLLGVILSQLPIDLVRGEENASARYDALYDVIMTRYGPDGKAYGKDESSPSIFKESDFPFDDKTYKKFNAALDAFGALRQKEIEAYSDIQRAVMQRHLWHVFDATIPFRSIQDESGQAIWSMSHSDRHDAVRPKIASLIQRLALTKAQILALPDTRAITVESGGFSQRHDPEDAFKPFLSAGLYSNESSWIGIGFGANPPAPFHQNKLKFRSAFLIFMHLPGGRSETLEYMARVGKKVEQFPVGTKFAFIEQAFLISDEGEMILSPLIISISLRAYLNVERSARKSGLDPTQSVAEFVMQPRKLIQGNAVMKALGRRDVRFEAGDVDIHNEAVEPFENVESVFFRRNEDDMLRRPRLTLCMECHKTRGHRGVQGGSFSDLTESGPDEIVTATLKYKRDHETWKSLYELWRTGSKKTGRQSSPPGDQPKQLRDTNGKPEDRQNRGNKSSDDEDEQPAKLRQLYRPTRRAGPKKLSCSFTGESRRSQLNLLPRLRIERSRLHSGPVKKF